MTACACGAEVRGQGSGTPICPACLIRLALEPAPAPEAPASEAEHLRLLGPVGSGPHGTVYLAYREHDDPSLVTVKLLNLEHQCPIDPDGFAARVRELAERLESIPRAGLTACLEAGVTPEGEVYVVAPYVAGSSVESYLAKRHCPGSERVAIAGRLCALVAHLHRHGIIHGSIKSTNVIVAESPMGAVPSLLDVGILPAINQSRIARADPALTDDLATGKLRDVQGLRTVLIPLLGGRDINAADSAEALAALLTHP
jgi:eukaryotic-like serine/threonine-protein kinase